MGGAAVERGRVTDVEMVPIRAEEELELPLEHQHTFLLAGVGVHPAASAPVRLDQRLEHNSTT